MTDNTTAESSPGLGSVGLFCGSSPGMDPVWREEAAAFGDILAQAGVRLVYGGGDDGPSAGAHQPNRAAAVDEPDACLRQDVA